MTTTLDAATASHRASLASSQGAALVDELIRHLLARETEATPALLARLEEAVLAYEVEFRGHLNGPDGDNRQVQRPPLELGAVLAAVFLELAATGGRRHASSFHIEALEARFHTAERLLTQRLECDDRHHPARAGRTA